MNEMNRPVLVVLAAGMGSRFGGDKQITPVDDFGHVIMDYSIFDAMRAGFSKVVIVIKHSFAEKFRETIGERIARVFPVEYAYQELDMLPEGFSIPEGRTKPWGTAHATLCAKDAVDGPFCVINADDFYGASAFQKACDFLRADRPASEHAMVGYRIENTLTENGSVARGVCAADGAGNLTGVTERTYVVPTEDGAKYSEDGGRTFTFIPRGTFVSMNMWCFGLSMMREIEVRFSTFLNENLPKNPLKCEYFLPLVPNLLIEERAATVKVLDTNEKWYGMTYKEDLENVVSAIAEMKRGGKYPDELWRSACAK
jgi:hypothetical protein